MLNRLQDKLKIICTATILTIPTFTYAQLNITDQDISEMIGTSMQVELDTSSSIAVNVGPAGANQTWDFTSVTLDGFNFPMEYILPAGTPFEANFSDANFVVKSVASTQGITGDIYTYHNIIPSEFVHLGTGIKAGDFTLLEPGGSEDIPLPLKYEDQWAINSSDTFALNEFYYTVDKIDAEYIVDGWGTLKLPIGDFEVLRIRENYIDTTQTYISNILISTEIKQTISYTWTSKVSLILLRISSANGELNPNFDTADEVWRVSDITTSAVENVAAKIAPVDYELNQNYPNPFNPETVISYSLAQNSDVNISVFDITGKLVETLYSGYQSAGNHQLRWKPDINIASGPYFYRMQAGDFVATKKMILIH